MAGGVDKGVDLRYVDQQTLNPHDRLDTLPAGLPEYTLGYGVIRWMTDNLTITDGDNAGEPFRVTRRQALFLIWWYAVDETGRWIYGKAVRRLAKGSGKSPFAAAQALAEMMGPVRLDYFDDDAPGGVVGKRVPNADVNLVATSFEQTANTMDAVRQMAAQGSTIYKKHKLTVGKTQIESMREQIQLKVKASSVGTLEGGRTTFTVADETEHWTEGKNGADLMDVLSRNLAKTGNRLLETSNAWEPGDGSAAEQSFEIWCAQEEGLTESEMPILYDAVIAPPNTSLSDDPGPGEISLTEGLEYVYKDCPWVLKNLSAIKEDIWRTPNQATARRFYLNQPTAAKGAWVTPQMWQSLANPERELVEGEDIVMFFDGSKSGDHSALVGCCMEDGHVFNIAVWVPEDDGDGNMYIDKAAVDNTVRRIKERFNVVAFWADRREWDTFVNVEWPLLFQDNKIIPPKRYATELQTVNFDMAGSNSDNLRRFGQAAEQTRDDILNRAFTHDGSSVLSQHVVNAHAHTLRNGYVSIRKQTPKSSRKIDAAVCMIGARMMYHYVRQSKDYLRKQKQSDAASQWSFF